MVKEVGFSILVWTRKMIKVTLLHLKHGSQQKNMKSQDMDKFSNISLP
jgi:hypothetical protein